MDPWSDLLYIIATPIVAFAWALLTLRTFGAEIVWNLFIIFNVAHHFPTFIRIYGDKDCFRRFRWSLILGPVIPLTAGFSLAYYTIANDFPAQTMFAFMMILILWDPWHFLMQHYGFMRIYDAPNQAPREIASWMDYLISLSWFAWIMIGSGEWLFERVLYALFNDYGIPLLLWIDPAFYGGLVQAAWGFAIVCTIAYAGYLAWCWTKGYFISPAKLLLLLITFSVMYLTYVPTSPLRRAIPAWTFGVGFATLGMVHVTQYLAIVWRYNRSLAGKGPSRSRPGIFTRAFTRGGAVAATAYVGLCLIYGSLFSNEQPVVIGLAQIGVSTELLRVLSCIIISVGFTSTLMHYYYDGFIWKIRHKENRENLEDDDTLVDKTPDGQSWWTRIGESTSGWLDRLRTQTFWATAIRQALYFGIPIAGLAIAFCYWGQMPRATGHLPATIVGLQQAHAAYQSQPTPDRLEILRNLLYRVDRQILAERKMLELNPTQRGDRQLDLAMLLYYSGLGKLTYLTEGQPSAEDVARYRSNLQEAIFWLERYLTQQGDGLPPDTRADLEATRRQWQSELQQLRSISSG